MDNALDATSRALIDALREDGRLTNRALAQRVGVSEPTVAARLRRLQDDRVIRFTAQQDLYAAGLHSNVFMDVTVRGTSSDAVARALAEIPEAVAVNRCVNEPTITAWLATASALETEQVILEQVSAISGIQRVECMSAVEITKYRPDFSPIDPDVRPVTRPARGDSPRDRILDLVRHDGRMSNQEIASQLDLSEGSVRRHIRAMIDASEIRIGVVIDPDPYGFDEATLIRLSIQPRYAAEAMETLKRHDEVASLSHVLGRFNIFAVANTRSELPAADFLDQLIAELPGVNEALVSPIRQTYKHDHTLARITDSG